jgi:S-ribosylhomocysteine lyase
MKVESFNIDHTTLLPGIYLRKKADSYNTYDIRMFRPLAGGELESAPAGRFLDPRTSHTLEHLLAYHLRDTLGLDEQMIYIGPMGCLTGFYILTKPEFGIEELKGALKKTLEMVTEAKIIPAASPQECGNYAFNNLDDAKRVASELLKTIF